MHWVSLISIDDFGAFKNTGTGFSYSRDKAVRFYKLKLHQICINKNFNL